MGFEKKPKAHSQFAPIEAPYHKIWQENLDVEKPLSRSRLADESLREVVEEIRKPLKKSSRKKRTGERRAGLSHGEKEADESSD